MLYLPFDRYSLLGVYVKDFNGKEISPKEKIEIIKLRIREKGFYKVKHFPDIEEMEDNKNVSVNFDSKTATYAGPSQFAFDQMLAQNMCKVTVDLRKNPKFENFKYALAGIVNCGANNSSTLANFLPEGFNEKILSNFISVQGETLSETDLEVKNDLPKKSPKELMDIIYNDTNKSHERADSFKFSRHERFLVSYYTKVEKLSQIEAEEKAKYYSEEVVAPTQSMFHAISDPGGVAGVSNGSTRTIAALRYLLEPFGVNVEHWSLVNGKDTAYNSYSFSDQFPLFESQPLFDEIYNEAGGSCSALEEKSKEALSKINFQNQSDIVDPGAVCSGILLGLTPEDQMMGNVGVGGMRSVLELMYPDVKSSMKKCATCHGSEGFIEFPGLQKFVDSEKLDQTSYKDFITFLNSDSGTAELTYMQLFQYKLGIHGPNPYGMSMPPSDWDDKSNEEYAESTKVSTLNINNVRRSDIAQFLTTLSVIDENYDRNELLKFCRSYIMNNQMINDIEAPKNNESIPGEKASEK